MPINWQAQPLPRSSKHGPTAQALPDPWVVGQLDCRGPFRRLPLQHLLHHSKELLSALPFETLLSSPSDMLSGSGISARNWPANNERDFVIKVCSRPTTARTVQLTFIREELMVRFALSQEGLRRLAKQCDSLCKVCSATVPPMLCVVSGEQISDLE